MFENKVIIITGSAQGIGFKTAELLAAKGACLIINARRAAKVTAAVEQLKKITPHVAGLPGDISNEEFCHQLVDFTLKQFGKIDVLINNAAVAAGGLLKESHGEAFKKVIDINIMGSLYPTLACLTEICKSKGAILFIGSVAGIAGLPSYAAYSASKRALVGLAESLRTELIDEGVFVGIHFPGFTENEEDKTIVNAKGEEEQLKKRQGVKAQSRTRTASKIIQQLERKKFSMYSSASAYAIYTFYRLFPRIFLFLLGSFRKKIIAMQ